MIAIAWRQEEGWQLEGATKYGPNVESFTIMVGWRQWYMVRVYVSPNDQPTEGQVEQALARCLACMYIIFVGDLNVRIKQLRYLREGELAAIISAHGL